MTKKKKIILSPLINEYMGVHNMIKILKAKGIIDTKNILPPKERKWII